MPPPANNRSGSVAPPMRFLEPPEWDAWRRASSSDWGRIKMTKVPLRVIFVTFRYIARAEYLDLKVLADQYFRRY